MHWSYSPSLGLEPDQLDCLDRVERLARERFHPRADAHDVEASFPSENFRDLHELGLLGMTAPREHGGLGVRRLTELLILRVIARYCASTALAFAMHSRIVKFISALGTPEQTQQYLGPVIEEGKLYASLTSEPQQSFRGDATFKMDSEFQPLVDGWFSLTGRKHFCSIGDHATAGLFVSAKLKGSASPAEGFISVVVPLTAENVVWRGGWDAVGMRATNSGIFEFEGVRVHRDQMIGQPGELLETGLFGTEFGLSYGAVYLGLADAALTFTVERVNGRDDLRESEAVRRDVAEMYRHVLAAELGLSHAASVMGDAPREDRFLAAIQAKRLGAIAAHEVTRAARRIAGGSGLLKGSLIERLCRDSESALVMPPSDDRCLDVTGRLVLGGFEHVTPVGIVFS